LRALFKRNKIKSFSLKEGNSFPNDLQLNIVSSLGTFKNATSLKDLCLADDFERIVILYEYPEGNP
jgi:hypothetical protein